METATSDEVLNSLRLMAWERAKGELKAMMQTTYPTLRADYGAAMAEADALQERIERFIKEMEDNM